MFTNRDMDFWVWYEDIVYINMNTIMYINAKNLMGILGDCTVRNYQLTFLDKSNKNRFTDQ